MRHFATESGKSKGQFYTPAEVSRVMAQILGIRHAKTSNDTTVYDPTCGSGSLLLKVGVEARHDKDVRISAFGISASARSRPARAPRGRARAGAARPTARAPRW
jgi:type I restriction-modification system DNA methylase subunit